MDSWGILIQVVLLLGACLALGGICSKLNQSPLVGYLLAGMFLGGPSSLKVVKSEGHIEAIAELGVALLLFSLGLEFSWVRLKGLGAKTLGSGGVQVVGTGLLVVLVGKLCGLNLTAAVAVGGMVSLSSTAAVLRVLVEQGELDSVHGRNSLAVLLVQDMAVVPLAILMTLLTEGGTPLEVGVKVGKILLLAAGLIGALYVLLNYVAVRALRALSIEQNRELTVLLAVVVGLGATWSAHAAGLSPALGAFVAGMFLGSSPFATQVRADVSSLRIVLLTLFFGSVGMVADPAWIFQNLAMVAGVASVIIVGKTIILWIIFRMLGQSHCIALATGLCLSQVGEFAFVLGNAGKAGGVIDQELYMLMVSSTLVTLFITPYLVRLAPAIGSGFERLLRLTPSAATNHDNHDTPPPEIVIIGFGPAGQAVGRALVGSGRSVLVLDHNPAAKTAAEAMGLAGDIGDASNLDVLEHAHLHHVQLVVIAIPNRTSALSILKNFRTLAPTAHVVVRSRYQLHEQDFKSSGAHHVIGDEAEVGNRLSAHVLSHLSTWAPPATPAPAEASQG